MIDDNKEVELLIESRNYGSFLISYMPSKLTAGLFKELEPKFYDPRSRIDAQIKLLLSCITNLMLSKPTEAIQNMPISLTPEELKELPFDLLDLLFTSIINNCKSSSASLCLELINKKEDISNTDNINFIIEEFYTFCCKLTFRPVTTYGTCENQSETLHEYEQLPYSYTLSHFGRLNSLESENRPTFKVVSKEEFIRFKAAFKILNSDENVKSRFSCFDIKSEYTFISVDGIEVFCNEI